MTQEEKDHFQKPTVEMNVVAIEPHPKENHICQVGDFDPATSGGFWVAIKDIGGHLSFTAQVS